MKYRHYVLYKCRALVQDVSSVLKLIRKEHRHWNVDHRCIALLVYAPVEGQPEYSQIAGRQRNDVHLAEKTSSPTSLGLRIAGPK